MLNDLNTSQAALCAGLTAQVGVEFPMQRAFPGNTMAQEIATDLMRRFRSLSLMDVCREALFLESGRRYTLNETQDMVRHAVSSATLSKIFTNAATAVLLKSYDVQPDTTTGWCREVELADFKRGELVRLTTGSRLAKLPRGGEAGHMTLSDEGVVIRLARFARQFVIDDQDIMDDNAGALLEVPAELGKAAAEVRPDLVYSLLLENPNTFDGKALFHADHANLATGGSALSAETLQAGVLAIMNRREGNRTLGLRARHLIVPPDRTFEAQIILNSQQRIVAADSGGTLNPLQDLGISIHADARIGAGGVVDPHTEDVRTGSATNWFLATDETQAPAIAVGYLRGTDRKPHVREFVLDRGRFGIGWDVRIDIAAAAIDYRGIYKATGAS